MRRAGTTFLAVFALVAAGGCAAPASEGGIAPPTADASAPTAAPASPGASPAAEYVFGFVERQPEVDDPRMVDWVGDECGVLVMARVSTMPVDDPFLRPDYVVEFAEDGAELRRWAKPYGAEIIAIAGERLHFRADHEGTRRLFWTRPDGAVGVIDDRLANPAAAPAPTFGADAETLDCPALPVFSDAGSVQCARIRDGAGDLRRVAWEGACS